MYTEIHHIAAVSSNFQYTIAFYTNLLGLRVIHKKRPFGGPKVCHFYWHEEVENFFTFYHCPNLQRGQLGAGKVQAVGFSVPSCSFHYWISRLRENRIAFSQMTDCLHKARVLLFQDPDGLPIKLLFTLKDERKGFYDGPVPYNFCIRGFFGVEIPSRFSEQLQLLLCLQFGLSLNDARDRCLRFSAAQNPGSFIDVYDCGINDQGRGGCGMVHHIAMRLHEPEAYKRIVDFYKEKGEGFIHRTHPNNFSSLYFWQDEGILFEAVGQVNYQPAERSINRLLVTSFNPKNKYSTSVTAPKEMALQIRELAVL